MPLSISEYLRIIESDGIEVLQCTRCLHKICPVTNNWEEHTIVKELPIGTASPSMNPSGRFVFREYYCPACKAKLDVDLVLKGSR
jgi:acetone carboxylase gamma subunit